MWTCPRCKRTFAVKNAWHSCYSGNIDDHFEGKPAVLRKTFDKLRKSVEKFGQINTTAVKTSIMFKRAGTFAGIVVRKDHLKLEFFLPEKHDEFPIEKSFQYSKHKWVHAVSLAEPEDVTAQLLKWLKISYSLTKS